MPKERSINPAAAQRKADKQKAVAKSKKHIQAQRNEKLARRNPERLQRQIDELKELETRSALRPKDKETLAQLEKDVRGIRRARDALGDAAPKFHERRDNGDARSEQRDRRAQQHLGKRRRDADDAHDSGSETDPEVRTIPMPRDTPPPVPRQRFNDPQVGRDGVRVPHGLPNKPAAPPPAQTVYSSAPQIRDLKKDAVRFLPAAVQAQKARMKGQGRLLEPEEMDRLEGAGYKTASKAANKAANKAAEAMEEEERRLEAIRLVASEKPTSDEMDLDEEARKFEQEMAELNRQNGAEKGGGKGVAMEEVQDDGT